MKHASLLLLLALLGALPLQAQTTTTNAAPAAAAAKKNEPPAPPANVTLTKDVVYGNAGGHPLLLHLVQPNPLPPGPVPAIIYVHGGGWHGGTRDAGLGSAYVFAQHGYVGATIEYRLSQEAPFPAQLEDCKCAVRFLRAKAADYQIDPARIAVIGDSAGGHLSAMMGLTNGRKEFEGTGGYPEISSNVQAVCDWFGPVDFSFWLKEEPRFGKEKSMNDLLGGPVTAAKLKYLSPISYVASAKDVPPFLIMNGTEDPNVPRSQSIELMEALSAKGDDVTLHIIKGVGHGGRPWGLAGPWPSVMEFFDHYLKHDGHMYEK